MPADVVALARWTAEYYAAGAGEAITAVLPPKARGARADAHKTLRVASITAAGLERAGEADLLTQRDLVRVASPRNNARRSRLLAGVPGRHSTLRSLAARGISVRYDRPAREARAGQRAARAGRSRSVRGGVVRPRRPADAVTAPDAASRRRALTRLAAARATRRVPRRAAARRDRQRQDRDLPAALGRRARRRAGRVLMLVPEIALTPAVAALFRQAFGDRVAIQHSGLSDGERHDQWQRIRRGDVDVVVGTRSAVFAPLERHRPDHRRRGARRARTSRRRARATTAATSRSSAAQRAGALVVLGSATPSMESYHNAMAGKYERDRARAPRARPAARRR